MPAETDDPSVNATTLPAPASASRRKPAAGQLLEFLAVGGLTVVLFPFAWGIRAVVGLDEGAFLASLVAFYGAILINDPHFASTYLLFYARAKSRLFGTVWCKGMRVRYALAGFVVPVALVVWGVGGVVTHSSWMLGAMFQLMFWLVSWHYVKQGFGVLNALSARQGVRFGRFERRALLGHCFAGWAYAWSRRAAAGGQFSEKGVVYSGWGHPTWLEPLALTLFLCSAGLAGYALYRKWRAERVLPPAAALVGLVASIWIWTVFSDLDPLLVYFVPALHSLQYLYFVGLLRVERARREAGPPWFRTVASSLLRFLVVAVVLGFVLLRGGGAVLDAVWESDRLVYSDATWRMGPTPWFALVVTVVNIHHYFMDNVLWRRANPDVGALFAPASSVVTRQQG